MDVPRCSRCNKIFAPNKASAKRCGKCKIRPPSAIMLQHARQRALAKGMAYDLCRADIVIPPVCPVLGIPIARTAIKVSHGSPSLDRIDNSKGYIRGNVRVISYRANILKSNATVDELEKVLSDLKFSQGR